MKKLIAGLLMLGVGVAQAADKGPALRASYEAKQVADAVYVIHGPREMPNPQNQGFMNNPGFIITEQGVVVVDPGGTWQTGEMVLAHIRKLTDQPVVAVFNTHVHGDHWLGNQAMVAAFPQVKIYGHPRMITKIDGGHGDNWVNLMMTLTEGASVGTAVVPPREQVDEGDVIKAAGLTVRVMHNDRAHTDTDIMLFVEEKGVIFMGDNAGYKRILRLEEGSSFAGSIEALNNAVATGARVFVPGHGPTAGAIAALAYRDYLQTVYDAAKAGYEDGLSDFEIRPELMPKLKRWEHWSGFEEELGGHISSAYLQAEAADFQ